MQVSIVVTPLENPVNLSADADAAESRCRVDCFVEVASLREEGPSSVIPENHLPSIVHSIRTPKGWIRSDPGILNNIIQDCGIPPDQGGASLPPIGQVQAAD
jgi:hypothetical protein